MHPTEAPGEFERAVLSLRSSTLRPELRVREIPAPGTAAPFSTALAADVLPTRQDSDSERGTGRFVLFYDPAEPEEWGGPFRVVCFVQAPMETDIGSDPLLADVAWSWLTDSLSTHHAHHVALAGTVTRIVSTGFGELAAETDGAQLEVRASWSPSGNSIAAHVESWGSLLCMLAGLPPTNEGVTVLAARRAGRE